MHNCFLREAYTNDSKCLQTRCNKNCILAFSLLNWLQFSSIFFLQLQFCSSLSHAFYLWLHWQEKLLFCLDLSISWSNWYFLQTGYRPLLFLVAVIYCTHRVCSAICTFVFLETWAHALLYLWLHLELEDSKLTEWAYNTSILFQYL